MLQQKLSIIIPTHNSEQTIKRCLNSLTSQTFPRDQYEIIVVDDGSTDQSVSIAKNAGADQVIITEPCFQGKARNIGVKNAKADLLAFIDSDCEAKEDWVKTIIKELEKLQAIGGSVLNGNPHSKVAWAEYFVEFCFYNQYKQRFVSKFGLPGCNLACTREAFARAGGFTVERVSEDVKFNESLWRAGIDHIFVPELQVRHLCRTKWNKVSSNMKLLGKYFVRNRIKNPSLPYSSMKDSRILIPILFLRKSIAIPYYAFQSKNITRLICAFPFVIAAIVSYCIGIENEIKNKKTN
jgi:glycosyltransferase involved in cell wall biosynthesis